MCDKLNFAYLRFWVIEFLIKFTDWFSIKLLLVMKSKFVCGFGVDRMFKSACFVLFVIDWLRIPVVSSI